MPRGPNEPPFVPHAQSALPPAPQQAGSSSSSSSCSSSSSSPPSSPPHHPAAAPQQVDPVAAPQPVVPQELNLVNSTLPEDRVDTVLRAAGRDDQRSVYMWTFPHTDGPGHATPTDFSRAQFASLLVDAYEVTGKPVVQWSVFLEVHPLSKSQQDIFPLGVLMLHTLLNRGGADRIFKRVLALSKYMCVQELTDHFHMVVETQNRCRWAEVARRLRSQHNIFASVSSSSSRNSYWSAFAYLYAPNAKKTKEDCGTGKHTQAYPVVPLASSSHHKREPDSDF